jgi:lactate racemase
MENKTITLPWGKDEISLQIPPDWHIAGILSPSPLAGISDPSGEVLRSLNNPIGSVTLAELAKSRSKIAIVIDDSSRPTPVARIFPAVLAELKKAGCSLEQITVVPALGVHRPMTEEEVRHRLGENVPDGIRWESHDCDDPEKLTFLGTTSRGTPVGFNKTVVSADLIISIGCIEPHIIASFGGGYKNLLPGVASRAAIAHNHSLNCQPDTFNMVGQPIDKNPMRLDLEEAAAMIGKPVFIINTVLNSELQVVKIVSGDPIEAHRAGAAISAEIYGAKIDRLGDIVISASHPMDQDLRQGVKALANTVRAVRPGGTIITTVRADEGVGVFGLANRKLPVGKKILKLIAPLLLPLVPKLKLKGMGEEDRFFLYFALQGMVRTKMVLYAPTIPIEIHERLPFVSFIDHPQKAIDQAAIAHPGKREVLVFPHGGMTYPILPA